MNKSLSFLIIVGFLILEGSLRLNAQRFKIPEVISINDTLLVGKFELTNDQWNFFLDNIQDSLKNGLIKEREKNMEFYRSNISFFPLSPIQEGDSRNHSVLMNYPLTFVTSNMSTEYINWLNSVDSTYEYYAPGWLDYLALYEIKENQALKSIVIDGRPKPVNFDSLASSDAVIDLNRNYFPWGTSIYGKDNVLFAHVYIPSYYEVSEISKKSFLSSRRVKAYDRNDLMPVGTFKYNYKGVYDLQGNVAELISNSEFTFGGSCFDLDPTSAYIGVFTRYQEASPNVGFRVFARPKQKLKIE